MSTPWHDKYGYYDKDSGGGGLSEAEVQALITAESLAHDGRDHSEVPGLPASIGPWTAYTPVWTAVTTNPSIVNGTIVGRYKAYDAKTIHIQIDIVGGSSTTWGSGTYLLSLPSSMVGAADRRQLIPGLLHDVAPGRIYLMSAYLDAGSSSFVVAHTESGNNGFWSNGNPFTGAVSDRLALNGVVEIA